MLSETKDNQSSGNHLGPGQWTCLPWCSQENLRDFISRDPRRCWTESLFSRGNKMIFCKPLLGICSGHYSCSFITWGPADCKWSKGGHRKVEASCLNSPILNHNGHGGIFHLEPPCSLAESHPLTSTEIPIALACRSLQEHAGASPHCCTENQRHPFSSPHPVNSLWELEIGNCRFFTA